MPSFPPDLFARILKLEKLVKRLIVNIGVVGPITDHIEYGSVVVSVGVAGGNGTQAVTFNKPFSAAPHVLTTADTSLTNQVSSSASGASTTGFTAAATRTSIGSVTVHWIAIL